MNLEQFKNQDNRNIGAIKRKLGIKAGEEDESATPRKVTHGEILP